MKQLIMGVMGFVFLMLANPALGMDQGCQPKNSQESEQHTIGKATCRLDLSMYLNRVCLSHAKSFKATFSGISSDDTVITCTQTKVLSGVLGVYTGNRYFCRWTVKGKIYSKHFDWKRFVPGSQSCSILNSWIKDLSQ